MEGEGARQDQLRTALAATYAKVLRCCPCDPSSSTQILPLKHAWSEIPSFATQALCEDDAMADTSNKVRIRHELNTAKFSWFHVKAILVSGVG